MRQGLAFPGKNVYFVTGFRPHNIPLQYPLFFLISPF